MVRWMLCALGLVAAFAANAAEVSAPFVVERIDVRNAQRVSPQLIAAESLLREGRQYSNDDLRAAAARLARLPFLAAAEISSEEGPAEGRRVVVISVTETRAFSFLVDARGVKLGESRTALDTDYAFPDPTAPWKNVAAGARHVIGRGEAHFAMTVARHRRGFGKNYSAWEIGYTGYDLFGTGAFATAKIRTPVDSVGERTFTPGFSIGLPLTFHQTVSVEIEDALFRDESVTIAGTAFRRLDEISPAHSISAGVFGGWADLKLRSTPALTGPGPGNPGHQIVQAGYSRRFGTSRLELEARGVRYQENAFDDAFELSANWVHRSRWGILRLGAGYVSAY